MSGYLARHGVNILNKKGLTRGTLQGFPLLAEGVHQSKRIGQKLIGREVSSIRSSDRLHVKQTGNIIARTLGLYNEVTKNLRSLNIGEFGGKLVDEVDPKITKWIVENSDSAIPGGQSPKEWMSTIWPEIRNFLIAVSKGEHPLIVAHGRPLNLIHAAIVGNGQHFDKKTMLEYPTENHGCLYEVEWDGSKFFIKGPI